MIPKTSAAAVAVGSRSTILKDVPIPDVGPDGGILRILATGVCGSDWPMYSWDKPARILGHEMVGVIEQLGPLAADRWGVAVGDVVALEEYLPCGHCEYCRLGEYRSCFSTDSRLEGSIRYGSTPLDKAPGLWGGFSQYLYLHPRTVMHKVPDGVAPHIAAMAIPLGNGFQWAYLDGGVGPGKTVVIQGPGQTGLACVVAAKAAGADKIILTGLLDDVRRLEVGVRLGATHVIAVDEQDLQTEVAKVTDGRLADVVIEATSAGPEIINKSLSLVCKRGLLLLASRKGKPVEAFNADLMSGMQMTVKGLRGHSYEAVELALKTMARGATPLELLSTHIVGLPQVDEALRTVGGLGERDAIHITVDPWKS